MNALKVLMMAGALAIATPAFAQFSNANTGNRATGGTSTSVKDTNPYNRFSVSFDNETISPDKDDADDQNMSGFAIDYIHGFSLSKTIPLFLETGIGLNANFWSNTEEYSSSIDLKQNFTYMAISVPVNVAYKFNVNENLSIQPYLGLNLKFNVIAKDKFKAESDDDDEQKRIDKLKKDEFQSRFGVAKEIDRFDKKDVGKNNTWNRFQLGWHIGVGMNYKAFYLGLSYGTDFMKICKKTNTSSFKVGVGFNF